MGTAIYRVQAQDKKCYGKEMCAGRFVGGHFGDCHRFIRKIRSSPIFEMKDVKKSL